MALPEEAVEGGQGGLQAVEVFVGGGAGVSGDEGPAFALGLSAAADLEGACRREVGGDGGTLRLDPPPQAAPGSRIATTAAAPDGWSLQHAGQVAACRRVTFCFTPQNRDSPRPITGAAAPGAAGGGSIDHANAGDPDHHALRFLDDLRLLTP